MSQSGSEPGEVDANGNANDGRTDRGRWAAGPLLAPLASAGLALAALDAGSFLGLASALTVDAALAAGAAMESRSLRHTLPQVTRRAVGQCALGVERDITIDLHNPSGRRLKMTVRDDAPTGWAREDLHVVLEPYARATKTYRTRPPRRGTHLFGDLHVRVDGRLGARTFVEPAREEVRVYPAIASGKSALKMQSLMELGARTVRRTGGAGEFAHLREYVSGDAYRDVDWRATAKRHRPITRTYQHERSQHVMLAIDLSRLMGAELDGLTKLDHAVSAALLLAFAALKNGDRVGVVLFSDVVHHFVPPGRGRAQYKRILDATFDARVGDAAVDFGRLLYFVRSRVKRRCLFVLFSDLLDEDHADHMIEHARLLRQRHLPLCVTTHDAVTERLVKAPLRRADDVYLRAAAIDLTRERRAVRLRLKQMKVPLVEAPANELALRAVSAYLSVKRRL